MKKIIKPLICLLALNLFVSCDEGGDPDPGATSVVDMSGDWFVQTYVGEDLIVDYARITTYNTAADDGAEMWVDDNQNIWWFKVKSPVNTTAMTFEGTSLESDVDGYEITVTIIDGIIVKDGIITPAGNTADSISMDVEFSDDPGTIYSLVGYKRNGLLEDEH